MISNKTKILRLESGQESLALVAAKKLLTDKPTDHSALNLEHMKAFLSSSSNILILAIQNDEPIGFLSAYVMPRFDRSEYMAYFYEIEVCPKFRRQNIATRMITLLKESLYSQGVTSLWVGTDVENTAAMKLYETTGAIREPELIYELWYKDLTT